MQLSRIPPLDYLWRTVATWPRHSPTLRERKIVRLTVRGKLTSFHCEERAARDKRAALLVSVIG